MKIEDAKKDPYWKYFIQWIESTGESEAILVKDELMLWKGYWLAFLAGVDAEERFWRKSANDAGH